MKILNRGPANLRIFFCWRCTQFLLSFSLAFKLQLLLPLQSFSTYFYHTFSSFQFSCPSFFTLHISCSLFFLPSLSDHFSFFTIELSSLYEMCFGSDSSLSKESPFCFTPDRDQMAPTQIVQQTSFASFPILGGSLTLQLNLQQSLVRQIFHYPILSPAVFCFAYQRFSGAYATESLNKLPISWSCLSVCPSFRTYNYSWKS